LAVSIVMALGVFMIAAVTAFQLEGDSSGRATGSGGFAFVGSSTAPVYGDLNDPLTRESFGLSGLGEKVSFVSMRLREGDEASCLNLNQPLSPEILGVNPEALNARGAFRFAMAAPNFNVKDGWWLLEASLDDGSIPAVADVNTVLWSLRIQAGDCVKPAGLDGVRFRVVGVLADSLLQGSLLISERHFIRLFPDAGGYRRFLVDAPQDESVRLEAFLTRALQSSGMEMETSASRLARLREVRNTYISMFQILGGLGLLLATAGLGAVVARNLLERRAELAFLNCAGFSKGRIRQLLTWEQAWLALSGMGLGIGCALLAVWPSLSRQGGAYPFASLVLAALSILVVFAFTVWRAIELGLRGTRVENLRSE
jgi:hypothetical protein